MFFICSFFLVDLSDRLSGVKRGKFSKRVATGKILGNIMSIFNDVWGGKGQATHRGALLAALFDGLSPSSICQTFSNQLDVSDSSLKKAMDMGPSWKKTHLFSDSVASGVTRVRIDPIEVNVTLVQVCDNLLTQKSGQFNQIYYYDCEKIELYEKYTELYPSIVRQCLSEGVSIPSKPRSSGVFLYQFLPELSLHKKGKPKNCPYCTNHKKYIDEVVSHREKLDDSFSQNDVLDILFEISYYEKKVKKCEAHKERQKHQRSYVSDIRKNLNGNGREVLMYYDFVTWYDDTGNKTNCLVFVAITKERNLYKTRYYDVLCSDRKTNSHDHYFYVAAMQMLFLETDIFWSKLGGKKVDIIHMSGDNGKPFVSKFSCFVESYMQMKTGIIIHLCPLCAHHAENMCDSHGGHIKPKLSKLAVQNNYPKNDADLKDFLERNSKNTFVYPIPRINRQSIDENFYSTIGGFKKIRAIEGLGNVGEIEYLAELDDLSTLGLMRTRTYAGQPDVYVGPNMGPSQKHPTWKFFDMQGWVPGSRCNLCTAVQQRTVFWSGHTGKCPFTSRRKAQKQLKVLKKALKRSKAEAEAEADDADAQVNNIVFIVYFLSYCLLTSWTQS
jgi:hypothetical protein